MGPVWSAIDWWNMAIWPGSEAMCSNPEAPEIRQGRPVCTDWSSWLSAPHSRSPQCKAMPRSEPGAPERRISPASVSSKLSSPVCRQRPSTAMARSSRRSAAGSEPVRTARAEADPAPSAIRSGRRSSAATPSTLVVQQAVIISITRARAPKSVMRTNPPRTAVDRPRLLC